MKRKALYIIGGFIAVCGAAYLGMYLYVRAVPMSDCSWRARVSQNPSYDILNTKSRLGDDVDFYHSFESPADTSRLFESNAENIQVVELGTKVNAEGVTIGRRAVSIFPTGVARIFWTEGDEFWFVQADSIRVAKAVEEQCFSN